MRLLRPALCLYLGLVLSIAYTTAFGTMGMSEYSRLQVRARTLEENLAALERINKGLTEELRSLSSDPETVALLARDLGYYRRGERRVAVQGLPLSVEGRTVGRLVTTEDRRPARESALRLALFLLPLAVHALLRIGGREIRHGDTARRR